MIPNTLKEQLARCGQSHLLRFAAELTPDQTRRLVQQIEACDFPMLQAIWKSSLSQPTALSSLDRPALACAPRTVVYRPESEADASAWKAAAEAGEAELHAGRVGVITVAGGQGTRLGFEHPKGLFPIGPVTKRSLFQIFAEQILARRRRHDAKIPWFIMTSSATHEETVAFFETQQFFGLPRDTVAFFQQGSLPALDAATGQVLMSASDELALSPDGHGGLVAALRSSGLLDRMEREELLHLFYHQVDNPTTIVADPALIGWHVQHQSQLTTAVVKKVSPTERMGVLVDVNDRTEIIEYTELNAEQAARCDEAGRWIFWAGNTAVHVFDAPFLRSLAADGHGLPLHVARKNVPFVDDQGQLVRPQDASSPNAIKLERFIFDALPLADRTLIVESDRAREFNPVKNATGPDSPETCRAALDRIAREWATRAGLAVPPDQPLELSPLVALDADELRVQVADGTVSERALTLVMGMTVG